MLDVLAEVTEIDEVKTDLDIALYETHILDSLKTVELILALSDRFGIEISPAELDHNLWATPRKMVEYFEERQKA